MQLVQMLLPVTDSDGKRFADATLRAIQKELTDRFGGVTSHNRAPAEDIWKSGDGKEKDDIGNVEVMTDELNAIGGADSRNGLKPPSIRPNSSCARKKLRGSDDV